MLNPSAFRYRSAITGTQNSKKGRTYHHEKQNSNCPPKGQTGALFKGSIVPSSTTDTRSRYGVRPEK